MVITSTEEDEAPQLPLSDDASSSSDPSSSSMVGMAIENKASDFPEEQLIRQLKASMLIVTGRLLSAHLRKGIPVGKITIYGVTFGLTQPIQIIRLISDYEVGTAVYEQLLNKFWHPLHQFMFDLAVTYMLQKYIL